jgi:hypothetical protein
VERVLDWVKLDVVDVLTAVPLVMDASLPPDEVRVAPPQALTARVVVIRKKTATRWNAS